MSDGSGMSDGSKLEEALARLDTALNSFEVAVVRAGESDQRHEAIEREVAGLSEDRSRLAAELDDVKADLRAQEDVHAQISARVDGVMHNIRTLLGGV